MAVTKETKTPLIPWAASSRGMNGVVGLFPVDSCLRFNFVYIEQIPLTVDVAESSHQGSFIQKHFSTRRDLRDDPVQGTNWSYNFDLHHSAFTQKHFLSTCCMPGTVLISVHNPAHSG